MRIKTSYIYIYGAISHNVHYEKGCSVSPYMPYHMSEKGVPPYGKAFSGRQESPFRIAVKVIMRHRIAYMTISQCVTQSAENPRISHERCSALSPDDSQRVQTT